MSFASSTAGMEGQQQMNTQQAQALPLPFDISKMPFPFFYPFPTSTMPGQVGLAGSGQATPTAVQHQVQGAEPSSSIKQPAPDTTNAKQDNDQGEKVGENAEKITEESTNGNEQKTNDASETGEVVETLSSVRSAKIEEIPKSKQTQSDWCECQGEDGKICWYNKTTKEYSWTKPKELQSEDEVLLSLIFPLTFPWLSFFFSFFFFA